MEERKTASPRPVRVMIVDDSAVIRSIIEKILKTDTGIEIVGFAGDGAQAIASVGVCRPDVIILDIEMPVMDGITALPELLRKKPGVKVLICSTLSDRGADISIKALSLGAADCILKPTGPAAISASGDFHTGLLRMVKLIGGAATAPAPAGAVAPAIRTAPSGLAPQVVAIGSSTGGPNALMEVLKGLRGLPVPIVITQHMPKTFTRILAGHVQQATGIPTAEGEEGMLLKPGSAIIAPGGFHMLFSRTDAGTQVRIDDGPMENFCKPAVDPMLRSLVDVYGGRVLTVMWDPLESTCRHASLSIL